VGGVSSRGKGKINDKTGDEKVKRLNLGAEHLNTKGKTSDRGGKEKCSNNLKIESNKSIEIRVIYAK